MELLIAGVDEAGRGPLAGPVVAAAVILDVNKPIDGLADSKKLSEKKREYLFHLIQEKSLAFAIAEASVEEIDTHNILQASLLAMQRAVENLPVKPQQVLVDGNKVPKVIYPCQAIVQGDSLIPAISAASILAKVTRDRLMLELDKAYPAYGLAKHKGYPTAQHMAALKQHGIAIIHRRSFAPVKELLGLK